MHWNQDLGRIGEGLAINYLLDKGWIILERNWRYGRLELDLIAKVNTSLVFIEVKTRSQKKYGSPEESVISQKEENIRKASLAYIQKLKYNGEIRFDIISIILDQKNEIREIEHIEDAFFPGL